MTRWEDEYGRRPRKLRVSVTDRCNLRCRYCMPAAPEWMAKDSILTFEELARVVRVASEGGIDRVRVTGGEPLLRRDLPEFVRMIRGIRSLRDIAMTTNGLLLPGQAEALREAGLDRITISIDSLDRERTEALTRRDCRDAVLKGIDAARAAGFSGGRLKINAVVMRGVNDGEIGDLAGWAREEGLSLRFIEFMPLEGDRIWNRSLLVPGDEIRARVAERFPLEPGVRRPGETAETFRYRDGKGSFGVIASVTKAFCADCDRVRVTADGGFRTCLFATEGTDLRAPLRSGAEDGVLAALMGGAIARKGPGHLVDSPDFIRPNLAMNAIGG
jgi:cyclic pyranopterin phosphate synthase